jgi:hypothetical protein
MAATTNATLETGQHVIVRLLHVGTLPATIESADAESVRVALGVKDDRIPRLVGSEMAVEVVSARGIHRHTGILKNDRGGLLTMSLVGVERIQRREFVRIGAHVSVTVQGIDQPLGGETVTVDVSGRGILISDPWNLPLGLDVRVELMLPGGAPVHAVGSVVREAGDDQKGICIHDLGQADEDRMVRFIRDREMQALRAARAR